jgi:hypothetical protein
VVGEHSAKITQTVRRLFTLAGARLADEDAGPDAPPSRTDPAPLIGGAMELTATGQQAMDREKRLVHDWRVSQLMRLGIPGSLAEIYADRIDWHQIARLVQRGCPARLALRIAG